MSAAVPFASPSGVAEIVRGVVDLCASRFPHRLRSIILTGSLARGEGTWVRDSAGTRLAGDADFLVVFAEHSALPSSEEIARLSAAIESRLTTINLDAHVGLNAVHPDYFRALRPHIFAYELIAHGKIVLGDSRILDLAPTFSRADIPLEDGFRTLMNRIVELLEAICGLDDGDPLTEFVSYRAVKLWLDMATSYLLFVHQYEPGYRARAARLNELAGAPAQAPIPLDRFASRVTFATRVKLDESKCISSGDTIADLTELIGDAHSLWRWELEQLVVHSDLGASDLALMRQWIGEQKLRARVRGWASVVRRYGPARSLVHLPRWSARAMRGSPRRALYAIASELLFALPGLLQGAQGSNGDSRWKELFRKLPVASNLRGAEKLNEWRRLGRAIVWNYHLFLEGTRS